MRSTALAVHGLGVDDALVDDVPAVLFGGAEKTTAVAFVTGGAAALVDFEEHRVGIAVDANLLHLLGMTGGFALEPELVARRAPVTRAAGGEGFLPGLPIHVGNHEDF